MKNSTRITVAKPCSEKFENFNVTSNGGFCNTCSKEVIDFTKMTDKQMQSHFNGTPGETCGRFKKSQVRTYETNILASMRPNLFSGALATFSFSLLALCAAPNTNGQELASIEPSIRKELQIVQDKSIIDNLAVDKYTVKGTVILDEDNLPLPGVNVVLKGTAQGTSTDFDGKFEFPSPLEAGDILVFSYIGYESQEYIIEPSESEILDITITIDSSNITLMGEVVVGGAYVSKRNIFQKFADLFRK